MKSLLLVTLILGSSAFADLVVPNQIKITKENARQAWKFMADKMGITPEENVNPRSPEEVGIGADGSFTCTKNNQEKPNESKCTFVSDQTPSNSFSITGGDAYDAADIMRNNLGMDLDQSGNVSAKGRVVCFKVPKTSPDANCLFVPARAREPSSVKKKK